VLMNSFKPEILSSIIADIYDCALAPDRWPEALTRVNAAVNGAYTTISLADPKFVMPRMASHSPWDPVMLKILNEEYGVDGVPGLREVAYGDIDTPRSTFEQMSEAAFQQSKFYQEWVQPQGLREGCVMKFAQTADRVGAMAFITHASRDVITADERRFMAVISPHVRRAAMIGDLLDHQRVQLHLFKQALDRLAAAVFLVDGSGRMFYANESGQTMLSSGGPILSKSGQIASANLATASALADAIARAGSASADLGGRGIGIPVAGPGLPPAVAYVLPLQNTETGESFAPAVAAVFVAVSGMSAPPQEDVLATIYDLTPKEARVMRQVGTGQSVQEIATMFDVSDNTIKSHLARVFAKTGTDRQAEIVKIVTALSSPTSA
jgi:DNA-binding CsgD family transcriptional regulator